MTASWSFMGDCFKKEEGVRIWNKRKATTNQEWDEMGVIVAFIEDGKGCVMMG